MNKPKVKILKKFNLLLNLDDFKIRGILLLFFKN
jgi:hypothetical protein